MNLLQLSETVHSEERAIRFLQASGILHHQRLCNNDHEMNLQLTATHARWSCSKRTCRTLIHVRQGTWLFSSRLPFRTIVLFIYCWSREMTSVSFCEKELGMSGVASVDWKSYLREVTASHLLQHPTVIGGHNQVVEIDESLFSRRKNHQGRMYPQQWVFGGICRETKECFLVAVPDRSKVTLMNCIKAYIRPGTTIMSDQWQAYRDIGSQGYVHQTVNHSYHFVDPDSGAHTQSIESMWRTAKMRNKKECGTARNLLDSYLCEFLWRQKYRNEDLFQRILADIVSFMPPE